MEWNQCLNGKNAMKDVTPFLLFESTGDSEEVKAGADEEAAMDESEGVLFRFDDGDDEDNDAQSCSYDHSSYINTSYVNTHHDQTQGLIHDDFDEDDGDVDDYDDDDDDDDDDDTNNWGESNMMDLSMQQNGSSKCCVDSSNQREIDRNFWETCLAT
ncbi:unnamed protein product [Lactuca saligna]|uniref:Uncharacterized protein n=1 Tax=Lactuca saligna TaxID=75948 RepID=A0AA35ZAW9_LACSI|nr:unnamed protein product [Lactuca saligna]